MLIEMVSVDMGNEQKVRPADLGLELVGELVVAGKDEPGAEKLWFEPWIADDGTTGGFNQQSGMTQRCHSHEEITLTSR
jgi:hypothetical protein